MLIRKFKLLLNKHSLLHNLCFRNSFYSGNVTQLFLKKVDIYTNKLCSGDDDKVLENVYQKTNLEKLLKDFNKLSSSISDISSELNNKENDDKELLGLMKEEKVQLEDEKKSLVEKILNQIYDYEQLKDVNRISSNSGCLFEISAGVGGKEAQLFANEMCGMYQNYFNYKNWTLDDEEIDTDGEYMKHYKAKIEGQFVWDHMKYEIGVHRVQRIPKTESKGRIHTSTITLACIPFLDTHAVEISDKDLKVETKRASGAGGQHVNTTESAVRITHLPSKISVECQEGRSQIKNREIALKKLYKILSEKSITETFENYLKTRKNQVGSANRNEKIRTYNYNQDRLTDHRLSSIQNDQIDSTVYDLEDFHQNPKRLDNLINSLRIVDRERELIDIFEKLE